jgi:RNA recognition motif-containing protein
MRGPAVVYVGNLPDGTREEDLQKVFSKVRIMRDSS